MKNKIKTKILVLTTGGTIEKSYDEASGQFDNKDNFLSEVIKARIRAPYSDIKFQTLMNKDSLNMTEIDRTLIYAALNDWSNRVDAIVVLHGTDTMDLSANYCVNQPSLPIPVIFTGSMRPFGFEQSDALQNMTEALIAAKFLPAGIYLSFHNHIFKAPNFKKNKELKTFEPIT